MAANPREERTAEPRRDVVDHVPPEKLEEAVDRLHEDVDPDLEVSVGHSEHARSEALRADQEREYDEVVPGAEVGFIAGSQARGALAWGAVGAVAGAVIGALIGLIPFADLAIGLRVGLLAIIGAMAGAAAGFVFGGGRQPEVEGALRDTSDDVTIRAHTTDPDERAEVEETLGVVHGEVAREAVADESEQQTVRRKG